MGLVSLRRQTVTTNDFTGRTTHERPFGIAPFSVNSAEFMRSHRCSDEGLRRSDYNGLTLFFHTEQQRLLQKSAPGVRRCAGHGGCRIFFQVRASKFLFFTPLLLNFQCLLETLAICMPDVFQLRNKEKNGQECQNRSRTVHYLIYCVLFLFMRNPSFPIFRRVFHNQIKTQTKIIFFIGIAA